jgi:hypothetical protein
MINFSDYQAEAEAFDAVYAELDSEFDSDFGDLASDGEYSYSECEDGYLDTYWETQYDYWEV